MKFRKYNMLGSRLFTLAKFGGTVSAVLLMFAGTAYADHTIDHEVQNLKGGVGALEQRLWDCENGIGGACPGTTGPAGADIFPAPSRATTV